jgi:hypothetical protein
VYSKYSSLFFDLWWSHTKEFSLSLSPLCFYSSFLRPVSIRYTRVLSLSLFFFLSTPDSHIEALERAQKRLEKEREVSFDNPLLRERMRNIFVATKNAHVFASSSSFGFGCTNLFQKSKERKKTPPQRRRRRRERERETRERERQRRRRRRRRCSASLCLLLLRVFARRRVRFARRIAERMTMDDGTIIIVKVFGVDDVTQQHKRR